MQEKEKVTYTSSENSQVAYYRGPDGTFEADDFGKVSYSLNIKPVQHVSCDMRCDRHVTGSLTCYVAHT